MADPVVVAAVVARLIAAHVEEDAVEIDRVEELFHDQRHIPLLIGAVDADVDIAVVVHDLPGSGSVAPVRMLLVDRTAHLGEIRSGDHTDTCGVAGLYNILQAVPLEKGALELKGQLGWIAGDDPRRIEHQDVRLEGLKVGYDALSIDVEHIGLAQIRLDQSPLLGMPPLGHCALLSRVSI